MNFFLPLKRKEPGLSKYLLNAWNIKNAHLLSILATADVFANQGVLWQETASLSTPCFWVAVFSFLCTHTRVCTSTCTWVYTHFTTTLTFSYCPSPTPIAVYRTSFVRGYHSIQVFLGGKKKWARVDFLLRERKIGLPQDLCQQGEELLCDTFWPLWLEG